MRRLVLGLSLGSLLALASGCGMAPKRAEAPAAPPGYDGRMQESAPMSAPATATIASTRGFEDDQVQSVSASGGAMAGKAMAYPQPAPVAPAPVSATTPVKQAPVQGPSAESRTKEHLVYTADFTLAVYQVEQGLDKTEAIGRELGGYLASRGDNQIVIRVPRERFREALTRVEKLGDVTHRDVKAIDVTDEFVDTESRLKNAHVMRDRLQALLAKAAVKEAIEIEKELGRVTEQIEVLEGKMKMLGDRIAFSTLTVTYAAKGGGDVRPNFQLPFVWIHSLGVHRLLNFQQNSGGGS